MSEQYRADPANDGGARMAKLLDFFKQISEGFMVVPFFRMLFYGIIFAIIMTFVIGWSIGVFEIAKEAPFITRPSSSPWIPVIFVSFSFLFAFAGYLSNLQLKEDILSPTFTMIQEHHGRFPLYHIDLYRLDEVGLDDLGLREYLFSEGIAAVEWFERLREEPEMDYLSVRISYAGANLRRIEFSASGEHHAEIVSKLQRSFA